MTDIKAEIDDSQRAIEKVVACKRKIDLKLKQKWSGSGDNHSERFSSTGQVPATTSQAIAKLPKLTLPKFWGEFTKCNTFWDSFQFAAHDNPEISQVDKFNYLNSVLEEPAARSIAGLTLTASNYENAVGILQDRFGKTQQIITAHMDELIKIAPCHNDRPTSLRYVFDQISVHTRGLASLGVSPEQYGSLLIPIIMSKLPNAIRLQVARNSTDEVWKIEELLLTIKKEVEARETSEQVKTSENDRKPSTGKPPIPTASALFAKQNGGKNIPRCVYCKELHYSASCERVQNLVQRKEILMKERRCLKCLAPGHIASSCQNEKVCRHCKQRGHHQSICLTLSPCDRSGKKSNQPEGDINNTTTTNTVTNKGTVLLQRAKPSIAFNEDNWKSSHVRILFDNGSQRSYITSNLKSKLNLKPMKIETLHFNTFGGNSFQKQSCELIRLRLTKKSKLTRWVILLSAHLCLQRLKLTILIWRV